MTVAVMRLNNDGNALGLGRLQPLAPGLAGLVHIIILYLAEVPVVGVQNGKEGLGVAVEGKAKIADAPGGLLLLDPVLYPQTAQLFPGGKVREHMHQVVVHVVRLQTAELFVEVFIYGGGGLDEVLGQLCGQVHPVPQAGAAENFPHGGLAAGVDVGGVQIVHAPLDGGGQLGLGLVQVDASAPAGEAHTAVAQNGDGAAVFVQTVFHGNPSCVFYQHTPSGGIVQDARQGAAQYGRRPETRPLCRTLIFG